MCGGRDVGMEEGGRKGEREGEWEFLQDDINSNLRIINYIFPVV